MSNLDKAQKEVILRIAISNISIIQDNLRKLPIASEQDIQDDGIGHALQAMQTAITQLHRYADEAGLKVLDRMPT